MIKELKLKAFKSFKDETVFPVKPLTVITGTNSCGKSSIIQSILIIDRLMQGVDINDALPKGHGSLQEFINKASLPSDLTLEATFGDDTKAGYEDSKCFNSCGSHPDILFVSADRYGSRTSIAILNNDRMDSRGDNLLKVLHSLEDEILPDAAQHPYSEKKNFLPNVAAWLDEISTGVKFQYAIAEKADISYTLFNDHRANNVGYGLSYTLPVIVALLWASLKPGRIVMIENPEAHLHPKGQSKIAELICKVVEAGSQVIIETHSDHVVNGIRVNSLRYEQGKSGIDRHKTSFIHVMQDMDSHTSTFVPVELEEEGRIYDAPADFFDQFNIDRKELLGF